MSLADLAGASLSPAAAHQEQMHAIVRVLDEAFNPPGAGGARLNFMLVAIPAGGALSALSKEYNYLTNGISHEDAIATLSAVVDRLKSLRVPLNSSAFSLALTREETERLA